MSTGFDINGNPCPPAPTEETGYQNEFEDYTGMGPTRLEDTDLYARSINISDARPCGDVPDRPANFRQKVCRRVEVPFTRKVKVPVRTTKIVPSMVDVKVPVKKLVQVPCYKIVDEEYTVFEEREAVREKEIWVKQIVPEKYMERVPVKMTRQIKKPSHEIQEVEEMVNVQVPSTTAIEVDGYRIDDVEEAKVVEVEEFQEFEYVPQPTGFSELARTRELGRLPNSRLGRNVGHDTYVEDHPDLSGLDLDSNVPPERAEHVYRNEAQASYGRGQGLGRPVSRGGRGAPRDPFEPDYSTDNMTHPDYIRAAGKNLAMMSTNTEAVRAASGGLGLSVRNTHTRHSDGTGVLVTLIERGSKAALAGLMEGDIITSVCGQRTTTVEEFAKALTAAGSELTMKLNRDGRRNVHTTINR